LVKSAFRLPGEQGEMHGHFPLHPLGHPGYAALRVRCVARPDGGRQNSALRASDMLPSYFPSALRYSPA